MNLTAQPIQVIAESGQAQSSTIVANKIYRFACDFGSPAPKVPADFYAALSDFESGRVVSLDVALNEPSAGI